MATVRVTTTPGIEDKLRRAAAAGLHLMATTVEDRAADLVNTIYPPASNPGESPRRRSGDGRRSLFSEVDAAVPAGPIAICGTTSERLVEQGRTNFNYMAYHETHGRPWLSRAFEQVADAAIEAGLKRIEAELR